jgi:hypothetical protein
MLTYYAQFVRAYLLVQYASASFLRPKTSHHTQDSSELSALHEVVGIDGVLVIHLERAHRKDTIYPRLNEVGIYPTIVPAVDVALASNDTLRQGCLLHGEPSTASECGGGSTPFLKAGDGCSSVEQAIAESHRQALLKAQTRNSSWTAIFEDDAVPVSPANFNRDFKQIWAQIPPDTGLVRLAWCLGHHKDPKYDNFRLVSGMATGGCATAYMVRRDFVPKMLGVFPCCSGLDACFWFDLYAWPHRCQNIDQDKCWGQRYMLGIDTAESETLTHGWASFPQQGIFAQDNRKAHSLRHEWKTNHPGTE